MRQKILVTGGTGLLGYAVRQILPDAVFVSSRDADLRDEAETRALFQKIQPTEVLHLAAVVGGVLKNKNQNADMYDQNLRINTHVLGMAREFKVQRLISLLSSCAFPRNDEAVLSEKHLHEGMPFEGNLGYSFAKRALDIHTKLLAAQYGCRFSTLTPVTMFGPNDNWDLADGHVTASLIHKCVLAKQNGTPLEVWGSGQAERQFVYAGDVARVLVQALKTYKGPETVLVAPDYGLSIKNLAENIAAAVDFKGSLVFDASKPEGQKKRLIRSAEFAHYFPDFIWTPLPEALKSTVRWFETHVCSARAARAII